MEQNLVLRRLSRRHRQHRLYKPAHKAALHTFHLHGLTRRKTVPRRYGYLQGSIKPSPVRKGAGGSLDVDVYPQGMKKQSGKSQRFETIGFVLEYGRSNMPAQPWMDPAIESAGESILDALENELMKD